MNAFRIGLVLTGFIMLVGEVSAQAVPLETGVIDQSPLHQPHAISEVPHRSEGSWQHLDSAVELNSPAHVGDVPVHQPQPMQHHLDDGWDSHATHGGNHPMHEGELHLGHPLHLDDPVHLHEEVDLHESPAACNCGDSEHCHGVCRDPGHPKKPKHEKPGDKNRGDCPPLRYRMDDCRRAGNPHSVARWAKCSVNDKYSSWFVGGGAAFFRGRCRTQSEGTWGLDYDGYFGHVNNWLKYTRGRKQGGEGAYRTDGEPKVVSRTHEILGLGH